MKLRSIQTDHEIALGQVVEFLPARNGRYILWAKVINVSQDRGEVYLSMPSAGTAWHAASDIGAYFGSHPKTVARRHGQTKKQAQAEANKAADARESSLAGGRCSSTGLHGASRRMMEDLAARGLTLTGRPPSKPEVQELPASPAFTKAAQVGGTELKLHYALAMAGCKVHLIDGPEFDAILAGLALLREAIPAGLKFSYDSIAGQCWTNGGEHDGLKVEAVQALADRLNHGG